MAPLPKRPVATGTGTAPAPTAKAAANTVTLATLVRGRVYFYKNHEFNDGTPRVIEDLVDVKGEKLSADAVAELTAELEELHQEVSDGEGEVFEKAVFHVQRNQSRPAKEQTAAERRNIRRLPVRQLPTRR